MESTGFDFFSMAMRAFIGNNACVAADGVAVDRVIYAEIAHIGIMHSPDESLESGKIFSRVAVHFDIGDMTGVADSVVGSLNPNLIARANWEINGHMT